MISRSSRSSSNQKGDDDACIEKRFRRVGGMKRRITFVLVCALALSGLCGNVCSQEQKSPDQLFQKGVDLAIQKDYQQAIDIWLPLLDKANDESKPKILKATALAYKKLHQLPEAWHHFSHYLRIGAGEDAKAARWLKKVEEELARKHEKIVFSCAPEGVTLGIKRSQEPDSNSAISPPTLHFTCPLTWWFRPGKHGIEAQKEGFKSQLVEIDVLELGDQGARNIKLLAIAPMAVPLKPTTAAPETAAPTTSIASPAVPESDSRVLKWVLTGTGAAVVATGGALQLLANSKNEELHDKYMDKTKYPDGAVAKGHYDVDYDDQVKPRRTTAFVLYGVGGAAMVAGVVLLAMDKGAEDGEPETSLSLTPTVLKGGIGALMSVEF
jgi:hypothetical protein